MKMFSQEDVLNQEYRAAVIREIRSPENKARKREMKKRQEVYRDNVIKWVLQALETLKMRPETLQLMKNHASNISLAKKIVNKKARCYRGGVQRIAGTPEATATVSYLASILGTNTAMQKADRFCVLQKNALPWVFPELTPQGTWRLKNVVLTSSQYDVIENGRDPERPACVILSDYVDEFDGSVTTSPGGGWRSIEQDATLVTDPRIAKGPGQETYKAKETFIWWTDSYHFTTDESGRILRGISPEDLRNPIGMIPGAPVAEDQDGSYWASGGEDIIDGSILVNLLATDMLTIMYLQGFGQLVITGSNIPEEYQVGPNVALILQNREGQDKAEVDLISHNPPIDSWLRVLEQYVAMLLSTNDLSPSSVAMRLDAQTFPSGIAMLIDKSEAQGSVEDRRIMFGQSERRYWEIVRRWMSAYEGKLDQEFTAAGDIPEGTEVITRFNDPKEVTTEKERLEIMKLRKELGLATQLDLVQMDNPNMTQEEAKAKLEELRAELAEIRKQTSTIIESANSGGAEDESEEDEDEEETSEA